jgi:hypothetical protein
MDCRIRYHTAKKLFNIASARFLPPERLHPASMQLIPASVGAIVIRLSPRATNCIFAYSYMIVKTQIASLMTKPKSEILRQKLPPPQAIQPVMSMPVRRLKFEMKACVAVRPAE